MKIVTMAIMVVVMGTVVRYAQPYIMKAVGIPELPAGTAGLGTPKFNSEEADLMSTVFKSALRLFTGSAKRDDLANELSDKLYAGQPGAGQLKELGIEMVKPGASSSSPTAGASVANAKPAASTPISSQPSQPSSERQVVQQRFQQSDSPAQQPVALLPGESPAASFLSKDQAAILARCLEQAKANKLELSLIPVAFLGLTLMQRIRRRHSRADELMPVVVMQTPADSEPYDMKHAVHSFGSEDFELLVALIYQRQGYRVSMPAGLGGGRGGDFTLLRKSEKVLVQCKKLSSEQRVPVERINELHEAVTNAGATRGMYVTSCGFSWDSRNFAKAKGITLINARTLDELISAARETPGEDLLAVSQWAPKLMSKVQLTPPLCPACEASMDQVKASTGSVWVCSQRPDCRGRRGARKHQKPVAAAVQKTDIQLDSINA